MNILQFLLQFIRRNRKVLSIPIKTSRATTLLPGDTKVNSKQLKVKNNESIILKGATRSEVQEVEQMVRNCAKIGDGFNLDEFCPDDGHFLHKFIHEPKVVIATDHHGNIKGAAICGYSTLSRIPGSLYGAYFIAKETERRKGIADALLEMVTEICKSDNCDTMILDVYCNNVVAKQWLDKRGFLATASIPQCGYVVNNGYTNSVLMYKRLDKTTATNLVSQI